METDTATWAEAVPWLALQVGSRPSAPEVAVVVPVWTMLTTSPGVTALRLAADAEAQGLTLDPVVVTRVLGRFRRAGIATASEDGPVTQWSPVTPGEIIASVQRDVAVTAASAVSAGRRGAGARATVAAGTVAPSGGLRDAVAAYLAENPAQDFSPTEISHGLGGRSTGAISKACERLVGDRVAVRTSDQPCRYRHDTNEITVSTGETIDGGQ